MKFEKLSKKNYLGQKGIRGDGSERRKKGNVRKRYLNESLICSRVLVFGF